jgi:hypothetical protein
MLASSPQIIIIRVSVGATVLLLVAAVIYVVQ